MLDGCVPWPEDLAERYRAEGYWTGEPLDQLLRNGVERHPDRVALVSGDGRRWTYAELDAWTARVAAGLSTLLSPRERVVVQLPNVPEFVVLLFALLRVGALPVLALPAHREAEIVPLCELSEAVAYFITEDYRELSRVVTKAVPGLRHVIAVEDLPTADPVELPEPDPGDVALFLLSGGTTGTPKLIPRTHNDYLYNARASAEVSGFDESTVYLVVLPASHNFALASPGLLGAFAAGGTVVLAPDPSPDTAFALIEREKVTVTAAVPPVVLLWMDAAEFADEDLSSLELLQVGGAKLSAEPAGRVREALGCGLQQVFGMAEGLLNFTRLDDPEELIVTTQGRPLAPADEVRVLENGELLTRGPYTLRGYYRAEEHNARSFTEDGFYRSGDVVRQLPTGHLIVEGRVKDQINRGGEKIPAEELENHLLAHPAVHDAAVVGMADPVMGERTCAFLVVRGEAPKLREIAAFLRERGVAEYKLPDRIEVLDAFPLTKVGKVSKTELARRLAGEAE
ncbi:2,3-dihydroxybenzoate-AMP ligase [Amycolatopsis bartoniae]|uniref:2,3-dihydroxybenzoate-AMP ligase n=1 Tax=Amycolatopsis bartoniae TaxID=941986 RepID=A0A8H9J115_9PSEU|nr:AMP-binding protein [Amycolatopsis bartoniae]MBB2933778.1 2,3-dihydroxybenzoate-AMP ligase [Amycolatopsis bartoniae]TVT10561.1 AMP-binding protein [Amycolatopsis bartoniae]GHF71797.1 2,3-dihydroxybenzoate-AMP ligase [Amycolatopsis bartoniae]